MGFLRNALNKLFNKGVSIIQGINPFSSQEYISKIYENPSFTLAEEKKTKALKAVEWGVFKDTGDGGKEEVENHTLSPIFEMPNGNVTWGEFLEQLTIWYDAQDNGVLLEKVEGIPGMKPTLHLYNPENFTVDYTGTKINKITISNPNRVIQGDELDNFMWIKQVNSYQGMAGVEYGTTTQGYSNQRGMALLGSYVYNAWDWNNKLVKKSGKRSGIISSEKPLSPDTQEMIRQKYEAMNTGSDNIGKPVVASGKLKFEPSDVDPKDSDWLGGEKTAHERICISLGVPPELAAAGESTYENRKEAKKEMYYSTIIPWCKELSKRFNYFLDDWLQDGEAIDFMTDSIPALQNDIAETIKSLDPLKNRVTVDEYRGIVSDLTDYDLPEIGGKLGAKILVSASDATLDELTQDIEPTKDVE
ncbi:phage portal protein [Natroniella sp. ANB-PHB2]|uniref:phage portal protein n=1 Tax=Natroniella sp. ANB-PHB2 TaxID=3384444 RepID=UPI0038D4C6B0